MKYGRPVDHGADIRLVDVVDIPAPLPPWAATPDIFIARMFPDNHDFMRVADDAMSGAIKQPDGSFLNPSNTVQLSPSTVSASGFQDICETALGGGVTGAARFGKIIRDMASSVDDTVFAIYQRFLKSLTFDKTKSAAMLAVLVSKGLITGQERTAILNAWPVS